MSDEELIRISPLGRASTETGTPETWPHRPTTRQAAFLELDCLEALYGGSAGGGKSDALLMAASQYVDRPGYRALLLRRTYADLALPGALMDRAKAWWMSQASWNDKDKTFRWPSGATVTFGYLESENDKYRYQGAEFQFIGFDELTQFSESQYTYLFSRVRKLEGVDTPLRVRAASNPGGSGHFWVRDRFLSKEARDAMVSGDYAYCYRHLGRMFVPSKLDDNPHLDREQYATALGNLDPVTRAQLLRGDWNASGEGKIRSEWLRYWYPHGDFYRCCNADGSVKHQFKWQECQRVTTIDAAGSSADVTAEKKGKPHSYSVISTFDFHRETGSLVWVDVRRGRWDINDLLNQTLDVQEVLKPQWIGVEPASNGSALLHLLRGRVSTRELPTEGKDKVTRASTALNELFQGRIFIARDAAWRDDLEAELLAWTGEKDEQADQIDTLAYACNHVPRMPVGRGVQLGRKGVLVGGV